MSDHSMQCPICGSRGVVHVDNCEMESYHHPVIKELEAALDIYKEDAKLKTKELVTLRERIQQLGALVYDAYELGQEDGRKIDGGPYKDVKEVFAALGENDNG